MINDRKTSRTDLEQVFHLASDLATSFKVDRNVFEHSYLTCIAEEHSLVLVAEKNDEIIGYLLGYDHLGFFSNGRITGVEELFVKPEYRANGIGKLLMEHAEEWARERGASLIIAITRRASLFYKQIGYEESASYFLKILKDEILTASISTASRGSN